MVYLVYLLIREITKEAWEQNRLVDTAVLRTEYKSTTA